MSDVLHFFRLSRPTNVLIAALAFGLACFISCGHQFTFVNDLKFWSSALCISIITATGYWINDVHDFKIDRINKPRKTIVNAHLSVKKALTGYFVVLLLTLMLSVFTLGHILTGLNLLVILLLFAYAAWFKRVSVVGNLLVAALTALVIYYAALLYTPRMSVAWTMMFAFEVTFLRELAKDIEDIPGDVQYRLQTLPIRIGIVGARRVLVAGYLLFILSCYAPLAYERLVYGEWNWSYLAASLLLVQAPAIWLMTKLRTANAPSDYRFQSRWLKWLTLAGFVSVILLSIGTAP
jgi:4-hydroxybenzoate polyprenyltransferase